MNDNHLRDRLNQTLLVKLLPGAIRPSFVDLLEEHGMPGKIAAGETVFTRGETNTDLGCIILDGVVKITLADGQVRYLEAPEILGEVQLFTPQAQRTATVESVTGNAVLTFEWHDLGAAVREAFSNDALQSLRDAIHESARMREQNLLDTLPDSAKRE